MFRTRSPKQLSAVENVKNYDKWTWNYKKHSMYVWEQCPAKNNFRMYNSNLSRYEHSLRKSNIWVRIHTEIEINIIVLTGPLRLPPFPFVSYEVTKRVSWWKRVYSVELRRPPVLNPGCLVDLENLEFEMDLENLEMTWNLGKKYWKPGILWQYISYALKFQDIK